MIWDRFDDAHDDLRDDIYDHKHKIEKLEVKLKKAGISYEPYEEPKSHNEPGPQGWYEDTQREEMAMSAYEDYLTGLLAKASRIPG